MAGTEWEPKVKSAIGATSKKMVPVFTIRIIYKSGATMEFDCFKFNVKKDGSRVTYSWQQADEVLGPIELGANDIAAVWQVGHREIEVEADQTTD